MARKPPRTIGRERKARTRSRTSRDPLALRHDLNVYLEEIAVQNDALKQAQFALEELNERFVELFDFAPTAYLTLDPNGLIRQINLTGATFLGQPRNRIEGLPLPGYIDREDRGKFLDFLRACRRQSPSPSPSPSPSLSIDIDMKTRFGQRHVHLIVRPQARRRLREFFVTIVDRTEARRFEAERERAARDHAALASRLISIQEEERQRIARDLHDNIGQQITALSLLIDRALRAAKLDRENAALLEPLQAIVRELDQHVDFLAHDLRPAALDLGLESAMRQFVRDWSKRFATPVYFSCDLPSVQWQSDVVTHVYRVVQEALNNVHKHAQAATVSVDLAIEVGSLCLTVRDDGKGFRISRDPDTSRGLGLLGMRERAVLLRGTLEIDSTPDQGTQVTLRVPLDNRESVPVQADEDAPRPDVTSRSIPRSVDEDVRRAPSRRALRGR